MSAYYNEIEPYAADWLRNLIRRGLIAPGDVDTRSIVDVRPDDLRGYTQCHFFAGIGVWSYALRRAGWPDDRPVWTGSCPCQPFSAAGKGDGFDDERHLWPYWHHLIRVCRPETVFGEQVASKDGLGWLDLVQSDMEGENYAFWPVDCCAAGVGAPHIRQRLWFVGEELEHASGDRRKQRRAESSRWGSASRRGIDNMANSLGERRFWRPDAERSLSEDSPERCESSSNAERISLSRLLGDTVGEGLEGQRDGYSDSTGQRPGSVRPASEAGEFDWLGDTGRNGDREHARKLSGDESQHEVRPEDCDHPSFAASAVDRLADTDSQQQWEGRDAGGAEGQGVRLEPRGRSLDLGMADTEIHRGGCATGGSRSEQIEPIARRIGELGTLVGRPAGPTDGFWSDVDWLFCRDGKWRPVESGTFPLAHGAPARVGRLRAYGNAIVAEVAQTVIETYLEHESFGALLDLAPDEVTVEDLLG